MLVKVIAEACEMPTAYLAKIINQLARRKLVLTQRGVGAGGIRTKLWRNGNRHTRMFEIK